MRGIATAAFAVALSVTAFALSPVPVATAQMSEPSFWRTVREPDYARAMHLMMQGMYLLRDSQQLLRDPGHGPHESAAILEGAIRRFALAHRLAPTEPQILFFYAMATSLWEEPGRGGVARRDDETLALFTELRGLDPGFEAMEVAFSLGIVHTRGRDFEAAAEEYHRAIARALSPNAVHWANLAEVTMLDGDVEAAVGYYERAIEVAGVDGTDTVLALWGLAVALDRLGEHRRAIEIAGDALSAGAGTLAPLRTEGVFFEPAYEIHWYEGLGHAALAAQAQGAEDRARAEEASVAAFRLFLSRGGEESPWATLARRHIATAETRGDGSRRARRRRRPGR
ncbi:MAG: hypothetical protein DRJ42_18220 [Deltaproteobacteria bacterium]|nr:MAG: hypothetical protein DRJ42_18220 [Deltaproteobacteria bacterium]